MAGTRVSDGGRGSGRPIPRRICTGHLHFTAHFLAAPRMVKYHLWGMSRAWLNFLLLLGRWSNFLASCSACVRGAHTVELSEDCKISPIVELNLRRTRMTMSPLPVELFCSLIH